MPIHDWRRVDAGLFHAFHQRWISALCDALNTGGLPAGYFALPEQPIRGPIPDVLTLNMGKANRITVRHRHGDVVAVIEIVSPGNKGSKAEFRAFVEKSAELIRQGVHLLVVDQFPPTKRDPQGMHKAIWDEFEEDEFELPLDKPLTLASYSAGAVKTAYVELPQLLHPLASANVQGKTGELPLEGNHPCSPSQTRSWRCPKCWPVRRGICSP